MIENREELLSRGNRHGRELALEILEAGLRGVDPYLNTKKLVRREGERLLVGGRPEMDVSGFGDELVDLSAVGSIYVIGAGKAVQRMALALEEALGDRLARGVIAVKRGEGSHLSRIKVIEAAHPVPDEASAAAAGEALEIARMAREGDLVITLFGSGCSSLFVQPPEGVSLEEIRAVYRLAIKYGTMTLAHRVMPYFSTVGAGRIVAEIHPARAINLLTGLSSYPRWGGRPPTSGSWVTSWPAGGRRMVRAAEELRAEPWWEELPSSMRSILERGDDDYEVPSPEQFRRMATSYWQPVDSRQMLVHARVRAEALGLQGVILGSWAWIDCEATAHLLAGMAREVAEHGGLAAPPAVLISGGELAVPVGDAAGIGGRNQEFVLSSALRLGGSAGGGREMVVAALDSDGTDGPGTQFTEAGEEIPCLAGGIVDGETLREAARLGIEIRTELKGHNSTLPLLKLNSGIVTGNTGICAGDLRLTLIL